MGQRGLAWTLVVAVLGSWCLAALAVVAGVAPAHSPTTQPLAPGTGSRVVLVGIPGLTWDVIDEQAPTLQRLADAGGSAALVARAAAEVACTEDAWLTVGSGERAGGAGCAAGPGPGRYAGSDLEPDLTVLAEAASAADTCVATYGLRRVPGEERAHPVTEEGLLGQPELDPACRIHLVEGPRVEEGDRSEAVPKIDAALAALLAEQPEGTKVVVAGMGQTAGRAEAQVLVVGDPERGVGSSPDAVRGEGTGADERASDATLLTSGSTRQAGLVQLVDLTPTLLVLADISPDQTAWDQPTPDQIGRAHV